MAQQKAARRRGGRSVGRGRQFQDRHQEIVKVAARLFAERGYDATSIGDIAEEVGLLKGSLYYYVPNKEDLLFAMISEVQDAGRLITESHADPSGDPVEQIRGVIEQGARYLIENREKSIISMRDFRSLSDERQQQLRPDRTAIWTALRGLIQRARDAGRLPADTDVSVATSVIVGALNYLPTWYTAGRAPEVGRMARGYATVLVDGLGVRDRIDEPR
jgi:AcrR family transcriptional regulator